MQKIQRDHLLTNDAISTLIMVMKRLFSTLNYKIWMIQVEKRIEGSKLFATNERIPSRVDLRRRGIIGDVRNQGWINTDIVHFHLSTSGTTCNAGYAFAVTSLLESKIITNGERLSVQMLLADDYNHHCEGGETFRAMEYDHLLSVPLKVLQSL